MADETVVLKELSDLKYLIQSNITVSSWPRWLSMSDACRYAAGKSRNWMREKLMSGEIYGYQETTKNGNEGNWVIDRNSIDAFFLHNLNNDADVLEFKKRAGI
jgi:hypothetical protein